MEPQELTGFVEVVRERARALAEFPALALRTIRGKEMWTEMK